MMVCDTPCYGHVPTYQISLIYLEKHKNYGPNNFRQLFDLGVKGQAKGQMNVMIVCDTLSNGHAPTYQISLIYLERQKSYGPDKFPQLSDRNLIEGSKFKPKVKLMAKYGLSKFYPSSWPWGQRSRSNGLSWWYVTHHVMVMHQHTKYHWPVLKGKRVMAMTSFQNCLTEIWPKGQRSNPRSN